MNITTADTILHEAYLATTHSCQAGFPRQPDISSTSTGRLSVMTLIVRCRYVEARGR